MFDTVSVIFDDKDEKDGGIDGTWAECELAVVFISFDYFSSIQLDAIYILLNLRSLSFASSANSVFK